MMKVLLLFGVEQYGGVHLSTCQARLMIVRGNSALAYHADILKQARETVGSLGLQADPLGGGRIEHRPEQKVMHVYGFSQAYGQANHAMTAVLLRQWFPFHEISVSWDGY